MRVSIKHATRDGVILQAELWCSLQVEKAIGFLEELQQTGESATKVTYNTLINVCATRVDSFERAIEYFNRMEVEGMDRDQHSYRAMQRACATAGEVEYMEKILHQAQQLQIARDRSSFTLEAKTYLAANQLKGRYDHQHAGYCIKRADTLVHRMDQLELVPEMATLRALLRLYCEAPRPGRALSLLQDPRWHTQFRDRWPDLWGSNMVIKSFTKVRHLRSALELVDWMQANHIEPNQDTWKVRLLFCQYEVWYVEALLFGAIGFRKSVDPLVQVLQRMQSKQVMIPEEIQVSIVKERLQAALHQLFI